MRYFTLLFALMLHYQCTNTVDYKSRNELLENIHFTDQKYRLESDSVQDSSERYKTLWSDIIPKIDEENQKLIKDFLDKHGHPDAFNYSLEAQNAPWIVLQHSTELEDRIKYYKYLEEAYKDEILTAGQLWVYLSRTHEMKFMERHKVDNTHDSNYEERIPVLKSALGIHDGL